ncbi:MAG: hypothetical protein IPK74_21660 [Deltaproteobacteria bacterium]|nr:hypothetical protein [Deltaproteobacteria bacterium]
MTVATPESPSPTRRTTLARLAAAPNRRVAAFAWAMLSIASACGGDDAADEQAAAASPTTPPARSTAPASWDVAGVLGACGLSHAHARAVLGPHRLHVTTTTALAPEGDPATHEAAVGERRPLSESITDDLDLVWATTAPNQPRFSLTQSNNHDRGRAVVVDGEQVYTRDHGRDWYVAPLQSDVHELWLDDAARAVHDVLALAAPQLAVAASSTPGAGIAGGDAMTIILSRSADRDDARVPATVRADPRAAWRAQATIDTIEGTLVLDATSGVWLSATVTVAYSTPGPDGRRLRGRVELRGETTPMAAEAASVSVPAGALPLLERTRYEVEREELLDGLAGR